MSVCELAVHYVPCWHADPRTDRWHGKGWTPWQLIRSAQPRYEGHRQPVRPAWGMVDDTDPHVAAREIDLAADHGVCSFLYHWHHFDDGPFLHDALDRGLLKAANIDRIKFALLWDNRDILAHAPALLSGNPGVLASGRVTSATFDAMVRLWVERYFPHHCYLRMEECPFVAIYDLVNFVRSMGGLEGAREAIERLQLKAAGAGFPGVHVMGLLWRAEEESRWAEFGGVRALVAALPLDSVGPASFLDHYDLVADTFPRGSYAKAAAANFHHWESESRSWGVPYIPNVTLGFDASPRCAATDHFERREYPFVPILDGSTPAAVRSAFEHARTFVTRPDAPVKLVTISSWNDWLEGASLLPDETHGDCYLEMLKRVFAREINPARAANQRSSVGHAPPAVPPVNSGRPPVGSHSPPVPGAR